MCATAAKSAGTILWFDVPWQAYTGFTDALPEHRVPHTYQEGTLELFKSVYYFVPWSAYEKILKAFGDRRFPHTYQDGTLEIMMSPSLDHERIKSFLGRIIELACLELGIRFNAGGSTTQRNKKQMQGLEPDESFYFESARPRGKGHGVRMSGPPDLVIEIDLRKVELRRMESYARLRIPEFWRYRKGSVEFFSLSSEGKYKLREHSLAFPMIGSQDLTRFLSELHSSDDFTATQSFAKWFRKQLRKK